MIANKVRTMLIRFDYDLYHSQIPQFRGAINAVLKTKNVLFHNHVEDNYRYAYPLVQYKVIGKKASILALKDGTDGLGDFWLQGKFDIQLGNTPVRLELTELRATENVIQAWDGEYRYKISKWLPLNQENYRVYQNLESEEERRAFLEKILIGNILSMTKGLDIYLEREVVCRICCMEDVRVMTFKGTKMQAFDLEFTSNVSIPNWAGLGKGVSHGFGVVKMMKK